MNAPYTLELSGDNDVRTIAFVGRRDASYAWAEALLAREAGRNERTEPETWSIAGAFDSDAEGGHSMFGMLDLRSALAEKITVVGNSII